MDIWDRQYRVRIGKNNSVGREIGKPNEKRRGLSDVPFPVKLAIVQVLIQEKSHFGIWRMKHCAFWSRKIA